MVLAQTTVLSLLTLPPAIQRLYVVSILSYETPVQFAVNTLVYNIVLLFTYLASALPFYIYTLFGGSLFREASVNAIKRISKAITCQH